MTFADTMVKLGEIRFFSKIVALLILLGIFVIIRTQPQALGAGTIENIVYMLVGGVVALLFNTKDK